MWEYTRPSELMTNMMLFICRECEMEFFTYDGEEPEQNCKRRFLTGQTCDGIAEMVGRYTVFMKTKVADKHITG